MQGGGVMDASILLKPLLSRGELRCIGATTQDKFRKFIEKDPGLERRFQQVGGGWGGWAGWVMRRIPAWSAASSSWAVVGAVGPVGS